MQEGLNLIRSLGLKIDGGVEQRWIDVIGTDAEYEYNETFYDAILKNIKSFYNTTINDHIDELSADQKKVVEYMQNNDTLLYNFLKVMRDSKNLQKYTVTENNWHALQLWVFAIAKKWITCRVVYTIESGDIQDVTDLSTALGFPGDQFLRQENPASVTIWATLAVIWKLLYYKVPMIRISVVPNLSKSLTQGVDDQEGKASRCRNKNEYFIVPCSDGSELLDFAQGNWYPPGGVQWQQYVLNDGNVQLPKVRGTFNDGVTSTDLLECISGYKDNGDYFTMIFDSEKLNALGISRLMYVPVESNSLYYSARSSIIHSQSAYEQGESALSSFQTDDFIGGSIWLSSFNTYYYVKNALNTTKINLPNVLKYPMDSNTRRNGTCNLLGTPNPDWYCYISSIELYGGLKQEEIWNLVVDPDVEDKILDESYDVVTPGNTLDEDGKLHGDKNFTLPNDYKDTAIGIIGGDSKITDDTKGISIPVDTKDGTVIGNPDMSIEDVIDDANKGFPESSAPTNGNAANNNFISIWAPSNVQMGQIAKKMWSTDFFDNIVKLFADPMDGIIAYSQIAIKPEIDGLRPLTIGNYATGISVYHVSNQYATANMGSVVCTRKYDNFLDYDYTKVDLYLPFVGFVSLNAREVMGKSINITYNAEVVTGSALISIYADGQFIASHSAQLSMQLPVSGQNFARAYASIAKAAVTTGADIYTGNYVSAAAQVVGNVSAFADTVQKSGTFSTNSGFMGSFYPYLIITRPIPDAGSYNNVIGYASNKTGRVGSFSGYCEFRDVQLSGCAGATLEELQEIKDMLKSGVIV